MAKYNKKYSDCCICGKKHYALGYCRKHWENNRAGRPLIYFTCTYPGCTTAVRVYVKEGLCSLHYHKKRKQKNSIYKKDGGKWGYREYRLYQKHKKDYCESCGLSKPAVSRLEIHHKDKNRQNSSVENLITLCIKCHKLLHKKSVLVGYKPIGSKYKRKFGFTIKEFSKKYNCSRSTIADRLRKNQPFEDLKKNKKFDNHTNIM